MVESSPLEDFQLSIDTMTTMILDTMIIHSFLVLFFKNLKFFFILNSKNHHFQI